MTIWTHLHCLKMWKKIPTEENLNSEQLKEGDQIEAHVDEFIEPIERKVN